MPQMPTTARQDTEVSGSLDQCLLVEAVRWSGRAWGIVTGG